MLGKWQQPVICRSMQMFVDDINAPSGLIVDNGLVIKTTIYSKWLQKAASMMKYTELILNDEARHPWERSCLQESIFTPRVAG